MDSYQNTIIIGNLLIKLNFYTFKTFKTMNLKMNLNSRVSQEIKVQMKNRILKESKLLS
jgi:hypothetical protein